MEHQNESSIIDALKNAPDMNPSPEFVSRTRQELLRRARNNRNNERLAKKYARGAALAAAVVLAAWITLFSGSRQIQTAVQTGLNIMTPQPSVLSTTTAEPVVFIYHTHNLESFKSELPSPRIETDTYNAAVESHDRNITLVGKHLGQKLDDLGVKTLVDDTDYTSKPDYNFSDAYRLSRTTVSAALKSTPSLQMVFDVHRDSLTRDKTTDKLNGTDVAAIRFVVARTGEYEQANRKLATDLQHQIETMHPSLAPQITVTTTASYNQDLLPESLLIEIGGQENSLQEEYRAAEILAQAISNTVHH